jgi:ZIP family zinc transporter
VQQVRVVSSVAIPLAALTTCSTLAGGVVAVRVRRELPTLIALTGGIVVAVALFDVLPESFAEVGNGRRVTWLVGAGFLAFFLAERALVLHHRDDTQHARAHHRIGALGASALSLHSFVDGLGIGLAFQVGTTTGVLVFVAVVSHDFADGMNTVSFILRQGGGVRAALRWLALDAAAPLAGAVVGSSFDIGGRNLGYMLAVYSGFFLFMGATDLLPEAHEHPSLRRVALTVAGFVATAGVAYAASR